MNSNPAVKKPAVLFFLFAFLVFLSLSSAFPINNYLYPQENRSLVNTTNFTIGANAYSLVKISGKEIMLLRNDELMQNDTEITNAIRTYYRSQYYPEMEKLDEIKALVLAYNYSRNDGGRFKGKEEYACRDILLLNGIIIQGNKTYCVDDASCEKIGTLFYVAPYTEGIRKSVDLPVAISYIKTFAFASDGTERIMKEDFDLLNNISDDNINQSLSRIKSTIPQLRSYKSTIESHILRYPRLNDSADIAQCQREHCYGMCPDFSFNATALARMESNITSILNKLAPFANYRGVGNNIYNSTATRVNFLDKEKKAVYYISLYEPLHEEANDSINKGEALSRLIINETYRTKVDRLKELDLLINRSITIRNFTSMDADMDEYRNVLDEVEAITPSIEQFYNESLSIKREANAAVFLLDSSELDGQAKARFDALKETSTKLDQIYGGGLTVEQYVSLNDAYKNVTDAAKSMMKEQKEGITQTPASKLRSLSKRVNYGLVGLLAAANVDPKVAISNRMLYFGGVALFIFFSIAGLLIFVFTMLTMFARITDRLIKLGITIVLVFCLLMGLGLSFFLYNYLDKTATAANAEEFLFDLQNDNSTLVVADLKGVSAGAETEMMKCANLIKTALENKNKSVEIYKIYDSGCTVLSNSTEQPATKEQCASKLQNNSAFILKYSVTSQKPAFTAVYDTKAYIYGDEAYYRTCTVSSIIN